MTDSLTATILKTAIEAIPLLTIDNFSIWRNRVVNMMDLQEDLYAKLTKQKKDTNGNPIGLDLVEKDAHQIWADINEYFASNHASNQARIFKEFLRTPFSFTNIPGFITDTKTSLSRLHEVGINLPADIIGYLILEKLPPSMDTVVQQITHSDKKITPDQVLDHLRMFNNNKFLNKETIDKKEETASSVSFLTTSIKPCDDKWNNPKAAHPEGRCWKLYPHLRPSFPCKKKSGNKNSQDGTTTNH